MIGIIQTFTKQDMMLLHRALLCTEEEIDIIWGELRQSINSEVVNGN
jgi:hypothetical protein